MDWMVLLHDVSLMVMRIQYSLLIPLLSDLEPPSIVSSLNMSGILSHGRR